MSYDTDRYIFYHTQSPALSLTECGIQICHAGHAAPFLKYLHFSMHFILEGKGVYEIDGKRYPLTAGEGFLIKPSDICSYTADQKEPWKYVYISFRGTDAEGLVHKAGLKETPCFSFENTADMQRDIYAMHAAGKAGLHGGLDALGYFLLVMSRLVQSRANDLGDMDTRHLMRAKDYIEDNYAFGIRVQDVALHACVERSYLYRIFMRHEGISPLAYLTGVRLAHAAKLLKEGARSVSEIGCAAGFFDASHFSKAFLKKYGCTPGEYRRR